MKPIIAIISALVSVPVFGAQLNFNGLNSPAVAVEAAPSTGLEGIYVVDGTAGLTVTIDGAQSVDWSVYGAAGAAYAEPAGHGTSLALDDGDTGVVATYGGRSYYFWIVDYTHHAYDVSAINFAAEQDCDRTMIDVTGAADRIVCYDINARPVEIDRGIKLSYMTLVYDETTASYRQTEVTEDLDYLRPTLSVDAPYCDSSFKLTGDRFLEAWGRGQTVESPVFTTRHVAAETSAEQQRRDVANEQKDDAAALGGSAPCEIDFHAAVTDAAIFHEWQFSHYPEFDPVYDRYTELDMNYTFQDQGTTYVRLYCADADGTCEYYGPTYEVFIGESKLDCPNAFTPTSTPGINDEWRVSYKSIVSFECHIFNRWGTEMFSFTDPSQGWDGKYRGKYVPAGVYYYVIKATGADGREYKLSGDINIIGLSDRNGSSTSAPAE